MMAHTQGLRLAQGLKLLRVLLCSWLLFTSQCYSRDPGPCYQGGAPTDQSPPPALTVLLRPSGKEVLSFKTCDSHIPSRILGMGEVNKAERDPNHGANSPGELAAKYY